MAGVRLQHLTIGGRNNHLHLLKFNLSLEGRKILSRDNTHGKLLKTDHGTFGIKDFMSTYSTCTQWLFGGIWNRNGLSGPKRKLLTVFRYVFLEAFFEKDFKADLIFDAVFVCKKALFLEKSRPYFALWNIL